jgi:hypothetical protein
LTEISVFKSHLKLAVMGSYYFVQHPSLTIQR